MSTDRPRARTAAFRRKLTIVKNGKVHRGWLIVGPPRRCARGGWECRVRISLLCHPGANLRSHDELGALRNALAFAKGLIRGFVHDGVKIWRDYPGDFGGF
jgi:hypothetical protein